ncbi:hypothetical protein OS493_019694 [Desmophyllum pertusum]|uniref:Ion transport domain-containing protein n=1 Tax=Desmophyllum pertusum TaxID=174260 RepID=A0A9W9YZI9_9CNID|nr:hypothetical protein OS493_019694 [Desmophyllum pertusum]
MAASFLQNSLSGPDPIHHSCVLNKELCDMAEQEYEFRNEYLELSDGCKEFAVALLNECRTMKEIRCVMAMQDEEKVLSNIGGKLLNILEFAIVTRNEKFVSHPYSQLVLNSEIYREVPFLEKSSLKQFVLMLLAFVFYPLLFMVWLVFDNFLPNHEVARMFHSPCVKFLIHCGSYQTFLFMLFLSSLTFQSVFLAYVITDWIILLFVIGHLVDLVKQVYHKGRVRFFSDYWNYLAVATVMLFLIHYLIWWTGRTALIGKLDSLTWENHAKDQSYTIVLISDCLLAVAILLAFTQNLSYIQANSTIGPLLQAFIKMLFDVMKFFFYFIFVFLAFVVSFTKLYLQYLKAKEHFLSSPGQTNQTDPLHLQSVLGSVDTIFWSLFGQIGPDSFQIGEEEYSVISKTGITLFGAFNIVAVLVALNMLIAILNDSYVQITANLDAEWKLNRARLWLSWVHRKGVLPPPFNLLYLLLPFLWAMKRLVTACCPQGVLLYFKRFLKKKPKSSWKVGGINEKERREVIRHLILRNLAKKSSHPASGTESNDSDEENENEATAGPFVNSGLDTSKSNDTSMDQSAL